jgi:DsbC/DsbD-like thiol-disulfide interchange protein
MKSQLFIGDLDMIISMRLRTVLAVLLLVCSACAGQMNSQGLVQFRIVMDNVGIESRKPFRLGLIYDIAPGWHIYWTNPGDAGLATTVNVHLPPGFTMSPIVFPAPTQFIMPGGIICYGYHTQLMLIATVTPPADLQGKQQIAVSADTNYLVCENVCIGGKQTISSLLPVGSGEGGRNTDLFNHWSSLIPTPAAQSPLVKSISSDDSSVTIAWNEPVSGVDFFPGASNSVAIQHITALNEGKLTQILFVPKYYDKTKLGPISCVANFIDAHGVRRAVQFSITLKGSG